MPINPTSTTATTGTAPSPYATGASRTGGSMLDKDDFLKLLIGQMTNQDPLAPKDASEQMGQMTQFAILEQVTNLNSTMSAASANDYDAQAISLIGKDVSYLVQEGTELRTYSGRVESVTFTSSGPLLTIDGRQGIHPVSLTQVGAIPATPPPDPDPGEGEGGEGTGGAESAA